MRITNMKVTAIIFTAFIFAAVFTNSGCDNRRGIDVTNASANSETAEPVAPVKQVIEPPSLEIKTEILPVRTVEVYSAGGKNTRWFESEAYSNPNNKFSFKVGGVVSEVNFGVGTKLLYERVLARLDSTECEKKIEHIKAELAQAEIETLEANKRLKELRKAAETNDSEINAVIEAQQAAENKVQEKRKELQAAFVELGHHTIRFTQRGRISSIKAKKGDRVEAGQTVIEFNLNDPLHITVEVPAVYLCQIGLSTMGRVKFEGNAGIYPVDVIDIGEWPAAPDAKVPVTVKLRNPYPNLKPGMKARVAFKFDMFRRKKHYVIPQGAMAQEGEEKFLYIVKPLEGEQDVGVVERRAVTAGYLNAEGQEILDGIEDGEIIVLNNVNRLKDGMKVKYK